MLTPIAPYKSSILVAATHLHLRNSEGTGFPTVPLWCMLIFCVFMQAILVVRWHFFFVSICGSSLCQLTFLCVSWHFFFVQLTFLLCSVDIFSWCQLMFLHISRHFFLVASWHFFSVSIYVLLCVSWGFFLNLCVSWGFFVNLCQLRFLLGCLHLLSYYGNIFNSFIFIYFQYSFMDTNCI